MENNIAISIKGVTKSYPLYHYLTGGIKNFLFNFRESVRSMREAKYYALRDITFEVKKGETFGVIGANGAGKSTLLGLVAGVLRADCGTVSVNGRVSSLLELGAGFHPDLTGRENILLNGVLLGLMQKQVKAQMEPIIEFSEIREFIDQPVRTYSTGMYVRLGFSVAVHLSPDILLVDEVMAVGDLDFQEKCLGKMTDIRNSGATIVFVSHDVNLVSEMCDRVAWLGKNTLQMCGDPDEVVRAYMASLGQSASLTQAEPPPPPEEEEEEEPWSFQWWEHTLVLERWEELMAGGKGVGLYRFLKRYYTREPIERGLSIRYGLEGIEQNFASSGICKAFDTLGSPRNPATELANLAKDKGGYGLFFCAGALSRVAGGQEGLEKFLRAAGELLVDGGLLIFIDYMGTGKWTDEQLSHSNRFFNQLPKEMKKKAGRFPPPPPLASGTDIPAAIAKSFSIERDIALGGALLGPIFSGAPEGIEEIGRAAPYTIRILLELEQVLMDQGLLQSDYRMIIAKKETA